MCTEIKSKDAPFKMEIPSFLKRSRYVHECEFPNTYLLTYCQIILEKLKIFNTTLDLDVKNAVVLEERRRKHSVGLSH